MRSILVMSLFTAILPFAAHARCTNVGGNPIDDSYCSMLEPSVCKPEYTGGACQDIVMGRCTNVGGNPVDDSYCSMLEPSVCKPEYTGNACMMVNN